MWRKAIDSEIIAKMIELKDKHNNNEIAKILWVSKYVVSKYIWERKMKFVCMKCWKEFESNKTRKFCKECWYNPKSYNDTYTAKQQQEVINMIQETKKITWRSEKEIKKLLNDFTHTEIRENRLYDYSFWVKNREIEIYTMKDLAKEIWKHYNTIKYRNTKWKLTRAYKMINWKKKYLWYLK